MNAEAAMDHPPAVVVGQGNIPDKEHGTTKIIMNRIDITQSMYS